MVLLAFWENGVSVSRQFNWLTLFLDDHLSSTWGLFQKSIILRMHSTIPWSAKSMQYISRNILGDFILTLWKPSIESLSIVIQMIGGRYILPIRTNLIQKRCQQTCIRYSTERGENFLASQRFLFSRIIQNYNVPMQSETFVKNTFARIPDNLCDTKWSTELPNQCSPDDQADQQPEGRVNLAGHCDSIWRDNVSFFPLQSQFRSAVRPEKEELPS